ncbi:MAG: DUF6431 domain-containing protein [Sphaerochaeta sp.]|nr:DUF6431 domain-containing protein [Sphaerochaeta sp.]
MLFQVSGTALPVWLVERCRPVRCPGCGEYIRMHVHGYRTRYIAFPGAATEMIIVVRFHCPLCRRTVTILPVECLFHKIHVSSTVVSSLEHKILNGVLKPSSFVQKPLQRYWHHAFRTQMMEERTFWDSGQALAYLHSLPPFSVLCAKPYHRLALGAVSFRSGASHHPLLLAVHLDSS